MIWVELLLFVGDEIPGEGAVGGDGEETEATGTAVEVAACVFAVKYCHATVFVAVCLVGVSCEPYCGAVVAKLLEEWTANGGGEVEVFVVLVDVFLE